MRYEWLLLDADGTLFDYDKAEAKALQRTFAQLGLAYEPHYAQRYREINGWIWSEFEQGGISALQLRSKRFELLFRAVGIESDPERFSDSYLKQLAEGTDLLQGAEETLRSLHGRVGLVLITNGLREVQRPRLNRAAIRGYFDHVVISEEVGASKPDGKIFDAAFALMDYPPRKKVLIVGDSLTSDIKGGSDYGIDTCWFNPSGRPLDLDVQVSYEIRELGQLLDVAGLDGRTEF